MNPLAIVLEIFLHCEESGEQAFMHILHEEGQRENENSEDSCKDSLSD